MEYAQHHPAILETSVIKLTRHELIKRSPKSKFWKLHVLLNVIWAQLVAEGGHGAVAVGDLSNDSTHIVLAVSHQGILLQLLLCHDAVVATSMAGGAIALEHGLAVLQVCCQGWSGGGHSGQQSKGSANGNWAPGSSRLRSGAGSTWLSCDSASTLLWRTTWCACRKDEGPAGSVEDQRHCTHNAGDAGHGNNMQ